MNEKTAPQTAEAADLAATLKATQAGTAFAIFALADALKASGAVNAQALTEKVERIIKDASPEFEGQAQSHFLLPLKQLLWAMSARTPDAELQIFGDLKVNPASSSAD